MTPHDDKYGTMDDARAVLRRFFGYDDFRPPQIRAVQAVLSGRDALLVLPTGGGKSICYQVPALARKGLTIVISPLISLMQDQVETLLRKGVTSAFINSTLSADDVAERLSMADNGSLRLLYLAPERLDSPRMLDRLQQIGVALLAVDEAHCISEWGHDFRPSYRRIGLIRRALGNPQTVALTATATPEVRNDIIRQLELINPQEVVAGFDRTNLVYHVVPARSQQEKDSIAIRMLRSVTEAAVVYAPTRKAVERVTATLVRGRIRAVAYHGGMEDGERKRAQDAFMKGHIPIIVATSAFGMGIDKPNVRLVVHHSMSGSLEAYYQEAGRAGRDGQTGTCVLLYTNTDRQTHEFFIRNTNPERTAVELIWNILRRNSDKQGHVPLDLDQLGKLLPPKLGGMAGSALRVLVASGTLTIDKPSLTNVWIRILSTTARLQRELSSTRPSDFSLLNCLIQHAGAEIFTGLTIDLRKLPPAIGGPMAIVPLLERLASEQFLMWSKTGGGIRLDFRSTNPKWLPVDWVALEKRRQREFGRLDAMEKYARTSHCRRAFVLRYFGDPDARPYCGACDRCLATTASSTATRTTTRPKLRPVR